MPSEAAPRRWAARYQFLDELWSGRDRIVFDPELEQALRAEVDGSAGELLDRLVPQVDPDARVWMVRSEPRAVQRRSTRSVSLDAAAELARNEAWQVALIQLPQLAVGEGRASLNPELRALIDALGEKASEDPERTVVIAVPCERRGSDRAYERLAELVEDTFGDARIFGLTRPAMAAVYDFGRLFEADTELDDEDEADDVPIEVDTTLGSDPRFELYLAVIGDRIPAEGLTFLELDDASASVESEDEDEDEEDEDDDDEDDDASAPEPQPVVEPPAGDPLGAMKAQLAEAQRRGDLQAIERLALLEKLEQAEDRVAGLGDELERLREPGSVREDAKREPADADVRLDAVLAREQALRWELERVRGELDDSRARPVETLEAEAASLRARLAEAEAELERLRIEAERAEAELAELESELDELDELDGEQGPDDAGFEVVVESDSPAQTRERQRLRGRIHRLLAKLERGADLSALELHRELAALRRLLA